MATRLGIELSSAACRLVEIEGRLRADEPAAAPRVRSFAVLPPSGADTDAMLASLKGRAAAVVVWGVPAEHRQVVVTGGSYESMRREAVASLASLGVQTHSALADIAAVRGAKSRRRPVVAALAAADPMLDAIRPLRAAGIRVRSLETPAMALAAMALVRRGAAAPDAVEAYIAVEETSTCIALMRDGALAIAHELPWGYIAAGALRSREDMIARLATELQQYFEAVGAPTAAQVSICGGVPELRTMSAMLTERLDLEVEPLDSMFGIDADRLPEPTTEFRDRVAELRLAWAAASDWPPHLNLLRARRRQRSRRALAAAAVVAGVVAGVGGAWRLARTDVWPASIARMQPPAAPRSSPAKQSPPLSAPTARGAVAAKPAVTSPPAAPKPAAAPPPLVTRSIVPRASMMTALVRAPQPTLTPGFVAELRTPVVVAPVAAPPPTIASSRLPSPPPVLQKPSPPVQQPAPVMDKPAPRLQQAAPQVAPPPTVVRQVPPSTPEAPKPLRSVRLPKPEPILPFDASLETILYSSDRKLAIVDGRIVGVGDLVRGARIVEISPTAVMLRDGEGRLRRLALSAGKP